MFSELINREKKKIIYILQLYNRWWYIINFLTITRVGRCLESLTKAWYTSVFFIIYFFCWHDKKTAEEGMVKNWKEGKNERNTPHIQVGMSNQNAISFKYRDSYCYFVAVNDVSRAKHLAKVPLKGPPALFATFLFTYVKAKLQGAGVHGRRGRRTGLRLLPIHRVAHTRLLSLSQASDGSFFVFYRTRSLCARVTGRIGGTNRTRVASVATVPLSETRSRSRSPFSVAPMNKKLAWRVRINETRLLYVSRET